VDRRLEPEGALRVAGRAQRGRGPRVREDVVLVDLQVRVLAVARPRGPRRAGAARDPGRAPRLVVERRDGAVLLRADLDGHERARSVAGAEVLLVAGEHQFA